jgi:hypothetical protein
MESQTIILFNNLAITLFLKPHITFGCQGIPGNFFEAFSVRLQQKAFLKFA